MSDLRKRAVGTEEPAKQSQSKSKGKSTESQSGITVVDVLRILGGLFLLNCLLSYFITNDSVLWGYRPWFVRPGVIMQYFVSLTQDLWD